MHDYRDSNVRLYLHNHKDTEHNPISPSKLISYYKNNNSPNNIYLRITKNK